MNFRWSNGHSYAVEFSADEQSFVASGASALRDILSATAKRYHDGATHTNMIHFRQVELHIEINGNWYNFGDIRQSKTFSYFEPKQFVVYGQTVENTDGEISQVFEQLEFELLIKKPQLMQAVYATYRWTGELTGLIQDVSDTLRDERADGE